MADEPANLILEHLRAIRDWQTDHTRRFENLESVIISHGKLLSILVDGKTDHDARFSELEQRLDRIERRLDLVDIDER